jgi:tetratricopeptide (TPR) repeat protein
LGFALLMAAFGACSDNTMDSEAKMANLKADSLSVKLKSPELKAINTQLLADPGNAELYYKRAAVYMMLRQIPEAIEDAKRAVKLDSTKAEYFLALADGYFSQNKTKLAKEELEKVEMRFPENTEALLKLSELYFLVRQYQKAIDYANKALKIDDHLAQAYYLKGGIYKESGDTAKAISSLETAIEQDNQHVNAFEDLGLIYAARKNPLAFDYYRNAEKLDPSREELKYAKAKLLQDLGKADEALVEYENILANNRSCADCLYNMGAIYFGIKKDNKKALEYFTKTIEIHPTSVEAYFARAYTYARMRDKASARADYQMCLKLEPNYPPAIEGLNAL